VNSACSRLLKVSIEERALTKAKLAEKFGGGGGGWTFMASKSEGVVSAAPTPRVS